MVDQFVLAVPRQFYPLHLNSDCVHPENPWALLPLISSYPVLDTINFPNRQHFRHDGRSELDLLHQCLVAVGTLC